jgi:hypothetical protein
MDRSGATGYHGYSRAELDDYLSSVAQERARLEATITEHEERTRAARAALGTHRVMVAMILQSQREIDEIRARAEAEAAVIMASSSTPPARVLDITRLEQVEPPVAPRPAAPPSPMLRPDGDDSAEYFDFLRGALVDDAPLGPRPETA